MYARIHLALKHVLDLVPSATSTLLAIVAADFPHSSSSKTAHVDFVRNLIKVMQYVPELKAELVGLVTERLVKIDVQVQVDMEDLEDDVEDGLVRDGPPERSDQTDDQSDDEDMSDSESTSSLESIEEEASRIKDLKANVAKMDAIMNILFEFHTPNFTGASTLKTERTFDLLLNQYATIILPTYRSRHSQFLLFHFAQTSEQLIDRFAGTCFHLMCDPTRPALLRQSSAAYLASFIARGAHVPTQIVRNVFQLLSVHLDGIRKDHEKSCQGPDLRRHRTFHAMVQALLYIFCFRWRDLTKDPEILMDTDPASFDGRGLHWAPGVKEALTRTLYSKFNPLKVCSPSIVNEFARIANHLRFMYIYPLIESNRRLHLAQVAKSHGQSQGEFSTPHLTDESYQQLDAYFPFDPYHLPISKRWLKGDYNEWQGLPGADDTLRGGHESDSDGTE